MPRSATRLLVQEGLAALPHDAGREAWVQRADAAETQAVEAVPRAGRGQDLVQILAALTWSTAPSSSLKRAAKGSLQVRAARA
jgi:hypothetical protein